MKKLLVCLVVILIVATFGFGSCAKSTPSPAPAPSPAPSPEPAPAPAPKVIELKLAENVPPMTVVPKQMLEPWAKEIQERTNGRVKITIFGSESLAKLADQYDAVRSGIADITRIDPGATPGVFPLTEGLVLPLIFDTAEAANAAHYELSQKYLTNTEYKEVKFLWTVAIGPANIAEKKQQIKTLEDFKGQKIAVSNVIPVQAMERLGATPVRMPPMEVYTALERGMVDGHAEGWSAAMTFKTAEVTKYHTDCNLWTTATMGVMNLDKWNSLPPDIQKVFEETSQLERSRQFGAIFDGFCKMVLETVIIPNNQKQGNPDVYYLPKDERARWAKAVTPMYEAWIAEKEAKGLPAQAFFDDMMALAEKYNQEIAGK